MMVFFVYGLEIANEFLRVKIDGETARFVIYTTAGDPELKTDDNKKLLFEATPPTSYTTIRIDGRNYKFGDRIGVYVKEPYISEDGSSLICEWKIKRIRVTQILSFVTGPTTGRLDSVKISYTVVNEDASSHKVGVRILLDTLLGKNDGAPFTIPGIGPLKKERMFQGENVPDIWYAFDNLSKPTVRSQGSLKLGEVTPPDRVIFANWRRLYDRPWDYKVKDKTFHGDVSLPVLSFVPVPFVKGGLDTAVAVYWDEREIEPGQSVSFSTLYGLYGATITKGTLFNLSLGGPAEANGPFQIMLDLENANAKFPAQDVKVTVVLPPELSIAEGEKTITIDTLQPSERRQFTWKLNPSAAAVGKTLVYKVKVKGKAKLPGGEVSDEAEASRKVKITGAAIDLSWLRKIVAESKNEVQQLDSLIDRLERIIKNGEFYSKEDEKSDMSFLDGRENQFNQLKSELDEKSSSLP